MVVPRPRPKGGSEAEAEGRLRGSRGGVDTECHHNAVWGRHQTSDRVLQANGHDGAGFQLGDVTKS